MIKLAIACDHGGLELKKTLLKHLEKGDIEIKDMGCYDDNSVDYPDYGLLVAEAVASGEYNKGIVICGTGIGISISANKVPGIRCALCADCFSAKATREHNDSNILALGARTIGSEHAKMITDIWLATDFLGGRHTARIAKISEIEKKYSNRV